MTEQNEIFPPVFKNKLSTFNKHSSTIADIFGRCNDNSLVMDTIKQTLIKNRKLNHYSVVIVTSNILVHFMANMGISRGDRYLDNTPMESFGEHYKGETSYGESFNTFEALKASIDQYIYF
ncbi:IS3 family transposase [Limosilactobacillus reuteri]|uniref:IS3 family transposase n=1 Tax=Limosilactobacillus reuteri TaxID=1598 RepID=UPI001E297BFD|nr:IS3 family transposase [Limosilactobacillus reuteri]MCC4383427.1 IS3 family transposase [Limosilactobacillus reuteri]MCC4420264.1 IS3 family transposase [Limosilactobacillus reuteri]